MSGITTFLDPARMPNQSQTQEVFDPLMNEFLQKLPVWGGEVNELAAALTTLAAGGAFAIPFFIDTTSTANADPGTGKLRFNLAAQGSASALYVDLLAASTGNPNITGLLDLMDSSTNTVKGRIRLVKAGDPTKYLTYDLTARTTATSHRTLSVNNGVGSASAPFANGDLVMMFFDRAGDRGAIGPAGSLIRRTVSVTTTTGPVPNPSAEDMFAISAQAGTCSFQAPIGSPVDGQGYTFRIKDNGTARSLIWHSVYRAGTELVLPGTTVAGKTMYIGFAYNAADIRWDLIATLNGI